MTNHFPRVTAILDRIPDAATRWPGWMWPVCGVCQKECEKDTVGNPFCLRHDEEDIRYVFDPIIDESAPDAWHGGDLDPRNMHHLWAMLEAVDDYGMPHIDDSGGARSVCVDKGVFVYGRSDNIIEAMLRCLEEATQ